MTVQDLKLFTMLADGGYTSVHSLALRFEFAETGGHGHRLSTPAGLPHIDLTEHEVAVWRWKGEDGTDEELEELGSPDLADVYAYLEAHPAVLGFGSPPEPQPGATFTLTDATTGRSLPVTVTAVGNFLNLHPEGYDNPVSLDFYQGELRLLVNGDADVTEPDIIDLETARVNGRG